MLVTKEQLEELYRSKTIEELLAIHGQGTLTDFAYSILENELTTKEVTVPNRPPELVKIEKQAPAWFRFGILLGAVLLINGFWVTVLKPMIPFFDGGIILFSFFNLFPTFWLWRKLFPKTKLVGISRRDGS